MNENELETYKLFVRLTDNVGERRIKTNSYFLALNSLLATFAAFLNVNNLGFLISPWMCFISFAGMAMCVYWYRLLVSFRTLNKAKFMVIDDMEKKMSLQPYHLEWKYLEKLSYKPMTFIESLIPLTFFVLYVVLFVWSMLALIKIITP